MTPYQTAYQLELAAKIIRTGHPWGYRILNGGRNSYSTPLEVVVDGNLLIPLLATPPDNRPLHNPDNLTAEQVGIGYRLVCFDDKTTEDKLEKWTSSKWVVTHTIGQLSFRHCASTYRLPLSVPWPKADPYADEKKTVPLGPEGVMPFTVIRRKGEAQAWHWRIVSYVDAVKVICGNRGYVWAELASDYERNESIPLTGKWDANAWEPCHKPAP